MIGDQLSDGLLAKRWLHHDKCASRHQQADPGNAGYFRGRILALGILLGSFGMIVGHRMAPNSNLKCTQDQCKDDENNGTTFYRSHTDLGFLAGTTILASRLPQRFLEKSKNNSCSDATKRSNLCSFSYVGTNSNIAKDRDQKAAHSIAEMMYTALQKLPKDEQNAAVKAIQNIKITQSRKASIGPAS
jgi:hypothetical protein